MCDITYYNSIRKDENKTLDITNYKTYAYSREKCVRFPVTRITSKWQKKCAYYKDNRQMQEQNVRYYILQ